MEKWSCDIIGTHIAITIDTSYDCNNIFRKIHSRLQDFEAKFSRFILGNWLHTLNVSRHGTLDEDARAMLQYSLHVAHRTDGYFDPTVGKRLTELGYGVIYEGVITNTESYGDYRDIEVAGDEVTLHGDILLEFGGVGKGYLIDQICSMIMSHEGVITNTRFLINFGGDLYGRGGWRVGLESAFATDECIGTYVLDDGFLACSAGTRRKWGGHHHLINPHTGDSAREVVASYIEGSSGISVDAYATALCVMPWGIAVDTLQKTPEISGVIVRYDGTFFQSRGSKIIIFG